MVYQQKINYSKDLKFKDEKSKHLMFYLSIKYQKTTYFNPEQKLPDIKIPFS